jgi:sporulation protein YlmC with PRC-barrel domain
MLRLLSEILTLPLVSSQSGEPVGKIDDYVLDAAKGLVVAYRVKSGRETLYLSTIDITRYYDNAILLRGPDVLRPIGELVRIEPLTREHVDIFGLRVVDQEGKRIGKVRDCLIHTIGNHIARIYVKPGLLGGLMAEERIFPRDQIVSIDAHKVVVRYDMKAQAGLAEPEIVS